MNPPRLNVTERMRSLLAYPKLSGPVPRMLVLRSQYWLDEACSNAARQMGWELAHADVVLEGLMSREQATTFIRTLVDFRPDFVFSVSLSGMDEDGMFAHLLADLAIPYVTWFVDDPRTILMGRDWYATDYAVAFTWERSYLPYLKQAGFREPRFLPLAVDPTLFNTGPGDSWDFPPTFVGNSMCAPAGDEWRWLESHPELREAITEAFDRGKVTRESFAGGLSAILDPGLVERLDPDAARHAELYLFVEGTRRLRHALVSALTPEGLEVRGDPGWQTAVPHAQGFVNYRQALPLFYRQCAVNVNVTSIQMATAVNQRVFDCPAAGGFLLTDAQSDIAELFPDGEMVVYHSLEEARDLLRFYAGNAAARKDIAIKARTRVLAEHTYAHRLKSIVDIVRERFGSRREVR